MEQNKLYRLVTKITNRARPSLTSSYNDTKCMIIQKEGNYGNVYDTVTKTYHKAHRIICEYAHGTPKEDEQVNHKCCNPSCCNPDHLEWVTAKENIGYSYTHGNKKILKISKEQVQEIIESKDKQKDIAKKYNITAAYVSYIKNKLRRTFY